MNLLDYHRREAQKRATKYAELAPEDRKTSYGQALAAEARNHAKELEHDDETRKSVLTSMNIATEETDFISDSTTEEERGLLLLASPQEILSSRDSSEEGKESSVAEG